MPIFVNHNFIKFFFLDVWLQICRGSFSFTGRSPLRAPVTGVACFSPSKTAAALFVNSCFPLLSGPSALKQWIFSSFDPSVGNDTNQASKLYFIRSFRRLSQADKILSTRLRLEGALIRPAGDISCSVSNIQPGPRSNAPGV